MLENAPEQTSFIANSVKQNAQSLADYVLDDQLHAAKNIKGSVFNRYLNALAQEITRGEEKLQELVDEYYPATTTNLIEEWEHALGIPDTCFKVNVNTTIEFRRKQVVAKMALMNLTTTVDFIGLAKFFGVNVTITNGKDQDNTFPMTFPFTFFQNTKEAFFTMIVTFVDIESPSNVFPLTFPINFEDETLTDLIICLFNKLKPAPVKIIARFKND